MKVKHKLRDSEQKCVTFKHFSEGLTNFLNNIHVYFVIYPEYDK